MWSILANILDEFEKMSIQLMDKVDINYIHLIDVVAFNYVLIDFLPGGFVHF